MDVLGMRVLGRTMRKAGRKPPARDRLHTMTLVGDLIANGLYFALVGAGSRRGIWKRGILLGLAAGIGGVLLPPILGLGSRPSARTMQTSLMTVAWYTIGGIAAATAARLISKPDAPAQPNEFGPLAESQPAVNPPI